MAAAALLGGVAAASAAAGPLITIASPRDGASYERGTRIVARFGCTVVCNGTVASGHAIDTGSPGNKSFTVTAASATEGTVTSTVHYTVWAYVNPLRAVAGLQASRIDMGVDYSGSGPILAIGKAKVIFASNNVGGPESCWGKTCAPPGSGMVVYRLLQGPYAGKFVYIVEHITISATAGQTVGAGQKIAVLHPGSPNLEIGWAAGHGPETLAVEDRHQCTCVDPGGWSSVEGRNFDQLLVALGAPAGYITSIPPGQRLPRGWPRRCSERSPGLCA